MNLFDAIARGTRRVLAALDRPVAGSGVRRPKGVALIVALVTIAVLSAAVVEYTYSTRVNLQMSVNAKDKIKSYFLARSAVNLSHLMLNFQHSLQNEADKAEGSESATGSCDPGMISVAMRRSNFQIYQYMDLLMRPFNSGKLETPVGGINLSEAGVDGFGGMSGEFDVDISPESGKLNVNEFAKKNPQKDDLQRFCSLVADSRYSRLFQREDEDGAEIDQYDIVRSIVDFVDPDEQKLPLTDVCTLEGTSAGAEEEDYADFDTDIEPRNAKLTHTAELHQIYGVDEAFMDAFGDKLTVYPVGKPNANTAEVPVFYSILCRNVRIGGNTSLRDGAQGVTNCQRSPKLAAQVLFFALALDGVREFFEDPLSVLMAYVTSQQSRLLPSAKKGQPVAFLRSSQVHSYLEDFRKNKKLMARFITYSPTYRKLARRFPQFAINPRKPQFPEWTISFDRTGIIRAVSTQTPSIFRIRATGSYGSTQSTVETVVDFGKTIRRLPNEKKLQQLEKSSGQQFDELKKAVQKKKKKMPRGRVLYWRENVTSQEDDDESGQSAPIAPAPDAGTADPKSGFGSESSDDFGSESSSGFGSESSGGFGGQGFGN